MHHLYMTKKYICMEERVGKKDQISQLRKSQGREICFESSKSLWHPYLKWVNKWK